MDKKRFMRTPVFDVRFCKKSVSCKNYYPFICDEHCRYEEDKRVTRVYLSGPITGLDREKACKAFKDVENILLNGTENVMVYNPIEFNEYREDKQWKDYMQTCLDVLPQCQVIVMLPGWEESKGAVIEKLYAEGCGLMVMKYINGRIGMLNEPNTAKG